MARVEILQELKKLTTTERLAIFEAALHLVREDLQQRGQPMARRERAQQLAAAAAALLPAYSSGKGRNPETRDGSHVAS